MDKPTPKRILLTSNHLERLEGPEIVGLEVLEYFSGLGWECEAAAPWIGGPIGRWLRKLGFKTHTDLGRVRAFDYDLVWCQHLAAPLLDYTLDEGSRERTTFAFVHLSPAADFEAVSSSHEDMLADVVLANSPETAKRLPRLGIGAERIEVFHNAAPRRFWRPRERASERLERLLIVSNHMPREVVEAMPLLAQRGVEVRAVGAAPGSVERIEPQHILNTDAVLTIGKTVQYGLASRTPVFVYDRYGGPGYLDTATFERAARVNFSGRCTRVPRTAEALATDLVDRYPEAKRFLAELGNSSLRRYQLTSHLDGLAERMAVPNVEKARRLAARAPEAARDRASALLVAKGFTRLHRQRLEADKVRDAAAAGAADEAPAAGVEFQAVAESAAPDAVAMPASSNGTDILAERRREALDRILTMAGDSLKATGGKRGSFSPALRLAQKSLEKIVEEARGAIEEPRA